MRDEYNHCINFRDDPLPITNFSYKIAKSSKIATMRITRNNLPLNLKISEKFVLKMIGLTEWLELHSLASKRQTALNDQLLKNLRAKFQWMATTAVRLGISPLPQLTYFELPLVEKRGREELKLSMSSSTDSYLMIYWTEIDSENLYNYNNLPKGEITHRFQSSGSPETGLEHSSMSYDLDPDRKTLKILKHVPIVGSWRLSDPPLPWIRPCYLVDPWVGDGMHEDPMDDEPMWAADRVVAPTPSSAITIPETANEFAIKCNHLTLVKGNQFDGRTKTDSHKHIHEFLRICDMFKYRDTKNEAARLMMFPLSFTGKAKSWLNELNEGTIEMWDEL
ncbi:hypothetical protein Tco_0185672 [Tanacetum coccineum]